MISTFQFWLVRLDSEAGCEMDWDRPTGQERIPLKDETIQREGKLWKVVMVSTELSGDLNGPFPIYRVFLTREF
jgi:hypothetical protein